VVKRKSKAKIMVADEIGGMVAVEDHRFKTTGWEVSIDVPKEYADDWFYYFEVECDNRGWGHSEFGQHEPQQNSGSITIDAKDGHQLTIIWERKRGGPIKINAASAGAVPFPASDLRDLIERISTQCRAGVKSQFYQRGQLYYDGLPWRAELWLG
jgi:hypothetical protein